MSVIKDVYTANDVAHLAGCSPSTVGRFCLNGKIPAQKICGKWLIKKGDAEAFIENYDPKQAHQAAVDTRKGSQSRENPHDNRNFQEILARKLPAQEALLARIAAMGRK